ncbi:hypothetical protein WJX84_008415, partial [Apatococcus fuscideae]
MLLRPQPYRLSPGGDAGRQYNAAAEQARQEELDAPGEQTAHSNAALDQQSHGVGEQSYEHRRGPTLYPPDQAAQAEPLLVRNRVPRQHSSPSQRLAAALKSMGPPSMQNPYLQGPNLWIGNEPRGEGLQDAHAAPSSWTGSGSLERGAHHKAPGFPNAGHAARRLRNSRKSAWFDDKEEGTGQSGREAAADGQSSRSSQQPQHGAEPWWLQAAKGQAGPSQTPEPGSEPLYVPHHMQRQHGSRGQQLNGSGSARPQQRESGTRQPGSQRPAAHNTYLNGQGKDQTLNGSNSFSRQQHQQQHRPGWQSHAPSQQWSDRPPAHGQQQPDRYGAPMRGQQQQQQQQQQRGNGSNGQGHALAYQQDQSVGNVPSWAQPAPNRPKVDYSRPPPGQLTKDQVAQKFGQMRGPPPKAPAATRPSGRKKASPRIMLRYDMTVKQLASKLGVGVDKLMASMAEAGDAASSEEE